MLRGTYTERSVQLYILLSNFSCTERIYRIQYIENVTFLDFFFFNPSFKIVMSRREVGHWTSSEVYFLVNLFENKTFRMISMNKAFFLFKDSIRNSSFKSS